jgi:hypothetical protein
LIVKIFITTNQIVLPNSTSAWKQFVVVVFVVAKHFHPNVFFVMTQHLPSSILLLCQLGLRVSNLQDA